MMTMTLRLRGLRCVRGDRRWVRRVVTGGLRGMVDTAVTADRRRVRWFVTVDMMVMGDTLVTGNAMVTGTGKHGCCIGHR